MEEARQPGSGAESGPLPSLRLAPPPCDQLVTPLKAQVSALKSRGDGLHRAAQGRPERLAPALATGCSSFQVFSLFLAAPVLSGRGAGAAPCLPSLGFSRRWPRFLQSSGSGREHRLCSCAEAGGIFPDRGSNPCPPHGQAEP